MSNVTTSSNSIDSIQPFSSIASLRAAHNDLLKNHRELLDQTNVKKGALTSVATSSNLGSVLEQPNVKEGALTALPPEFFQKIEQFIEQGRITGSIIDSEEDRWAVQSLLDYWATVLFRADHQPSDATLVDFDPELLPELNDEACPYLGLDAFQEMNNKLFFGRRRLVEEMIEHLKEDRLLAVVGPSGSGKSSVVFAGLLPALKNNAVAGSDTWKYYPPMVPGSDPVANLLLLLKPSDENSASWIQKNRENFLRNPDSLLEFVEASENGSILIIVDQFEELFTLCYDDELVEAFIANLLRLLQYPRHHHTVIITLRSDFEPRIARLEAFFMRFQQAQITVTPLGASDLREAIEKPAELAGLKFEAGIVDKLVKEILGEPAGLPLLQFSLLSLWKKRDRNRITWEVYNKLGGPREALTLNADEFYNALIPQDQITARRILLRLARTTEGFEVFRNRVRRELLYKSGEARDQVDRVLDKLLAARLLRLTKGETPADDQIEVAHEALVRNWRRLVEWIEQDRATIHQRLRLTAAAEQWRTHGKDPGGLLGGSLLEEAIQYPDVSDLEGEFIIASKEAIDLAEREKKAIEQREQEQTLALARSNKRLRRLIIVLIIFVVFSSVMAVWSYSLKIVAEQANLAAQHDRTAAVAAEREANLSKKSFKGAIDVALKATDTTQVISNLKQQILQENFNEYTLVDQQLNLLLKSNNQSELYKIEIFYNMDAEDSNNLVSQISDILGKSKKYIVKKSLLSSRLIEKYNITHSAIRYDEGNNQELAIAEQLQQTVNALPAAKQSQKSFKIQPVKNKTPNYVSIFIMNDNSPKTASN